MTPQRGVLSLELETLRAISVDEAVVATRAGALAASVPVEHRTRRAALLTALAAVDLTTLSEDDTDASVRALCRRAQSPLTGGTREAVPEGASPPRVAAVCVAERFVATAVETLAGSGIPVAAATGDFPRGEAPLQQRVAQIQAARRDGASEIDVVITRAHARDGAWQDLYDEICAFRDAASGARLKVILAAGDLGSLDTVARASRTAMFAGADFVKTSTGREEVNATLTAGIVMAETIRRHHEETGLVVGLKPAGGIRTAQAALEWVTLVQQELGTAWLTPQRFRIGASGLLDDIQRELTALHEVSRS